MTEIQPETMRSIREAIKEKKLNALEADLQAVYPEGFSLEDMRTFELDDLIRIQELRVMRDLVRVLGEIKKEIAMRR